MSDDVVARGNQARAVMDNPIVAEALTSMQRRAHEAWEASSYEDTPGREEAYRMLRAIKTFRSEFEMMIRDGAVAKAMEKPTNE